MSTLSELLAVVLPHLGISVGAEARGEERGVGQRRKGGFSRTDAKGNVPWTPQFSGSHKSYMGQAVPFHMMFL